jgi:hypothetical protein
MEMPGSDRPESPTRGYEFKAHEDEVIGGTARWIGIFAWFGIVIGALLALAGIFTFPAGTANLIIGAVYVMIGMWFRDSARSLRSVVETEGDDIAHLLAALGKLRSAFMAMVVLIAAGVALGILAAILMAGAEAAG